ncbi:MAG: STAS domain-containing protein [Methylococcales bacterium]|nr:MAG: anti-sigma factor antagonist [Methylococcales bacterium]
MKFDERQELEAIVVKPLENRLDSYVADEFKVHMKNIVQEGHLQIVLDLSDIDFVDSSGLGAIIATMIALRPQGQLTICNAKDSVVALFRLTRMDRVIPMKSDVHEALQTMCSK